MGSTKKNLDRYNLALPAESKAFRRFRKVGITENWRYGTLIHANDFVKNISFEMVMIFFYLVQ